MYVYIYIYIYIYTHTLYMSTTKFNVEIKIPAIHG